MDTHYHIWHYRRADDGTIGFMERDNTVFSTRRKANYALSDRRQYWTAGQVLQCVDGAFCQPMPEEMVDRGMGEVFGPKYVSVEQLQNQAKSIRPAAKRVKAMEQRDELDAAGRIKSLEAVRAELAERQAEVDAELARLLQQQDRPLDIPTEPVHYAQPPTPTTRECYAFIPDYEREKLIKTHSFQVGGLRYTMPARYCDQCKSTRCSNCFCSHWPTVTRHRHDKPRWQIQKWNVLGEGHGQEKTWHTTNERGYTHRHPNVAYPVRCSECGIEGILNVQFRVGNVFQARSGYLHQIFGAKTATILLSTPKRKEITRITRECRSKYDPDYKPPA